MSYKPIAKTDNLPIRHIGNVHSGKVRSVYWLNRDDSARLSETYGKDPLTDLAVMITSDRISAFNTNWRSESYDGVPGKGAVLNSISQYWFRQLQDEGIGGNHIVATPHPLVWIVEKAKPILFEAIAREYITGSMWRAYERGEREFCGNTIEEGLKRNQWLGRTLITPSTKGILPSISPEDDAPISNDIIKNNYRTFNLTQSSDVDKVNSMLVQGFESISDSLAGIGKLLVDTKFEFGYNRQGNIMFIDEVATPDSSRYWNTDDYRAGSPKEESKEFFRNLVLQHVGTLGPDVAKGGEIAKKIAQTTRLSDDDFLQTANLYRHLCQQITGSVMIPVNAHEEILDSLNNLQLVK